jgi:predicted nucleotidyltransferase
MLFGSRARGDGDDGSHFDVRHRAAGCDRATESVRLRRVLRGLGVPIGIVVIDEERARRRAAVRGTMVQRALHEGRLLVDA